MKIYIAGKITGLDNYKEEFEKAERMLKESGHSVMNPAVLPDGFEYEEYMQICFAMIDVCDTMYLLSNWEDSSGAKREHIRAFDNEKLLWYQDPLTNPNIVDMIRRA